MTALQAYISSLNPLSWWRLGEASGDAVDSGSLGLNGVWSGVPTQGTTPLAVDDSGKSVTLAAASSQFATVPHNSGYAITTTNLLSIHALIRMNAFTATNMAIASKGSGPGATAEWIFYINSLGLVAFLIWTSVSATIAFIASANPIEVGKDYSIVATVDYPNALNLYINGVAETTVTAFSGTYTAAADSVYLGEGNLYSFFQNGLMQDVFITNTVLTAVQASALHTAAHYPHRNAMMGVR